MAGSIKSALAALVLLLATLAACQSHSPPTPEAASPTTISPTKPDAAVIGLPPRIDTTTLQPDAAGQVSFYTDKSQKIRCQIEEDQKYEIACYGPFTGTPQKDGKHLTGVLFTREGAGMYVPGMGDLHPVLTLDNRTYYFLGWTIATRDDGSVALRFQDTGQGIDISVDKITTG
jgi:hypothetical protein